MYLRKASCIGGPVEGEPLWLPFLCPPRVSRFLFCGFRQKRSMGLTLAEGELTRLDAERVRDRMTLEKEKACAEQILTKIEDVL